MRCPNLDKRNPSLLGTSEMSSAGLGLCSTFSRELPGFGLATTEFSQLCEGRITAILTSATYHANSGQVSYGGFDYASPRFVHRLYRIFFCLCGSCSGGTTSTATSTCNFDADKQLAAEHQRVSVNSKKL